jgi:hypothetical protein
MKTLTFAPSTSSGVAGRILRARPRSLPNWYQIATANAVQTNADQKKSRGCGKKETNL